MKSYFFADHSRVILKIKRSLKNSPIATEGLYKPLKPALPEVNKSHHEMMLCASELGVNLAEKWAQRVFAVPSAPCFHQSLKMLNLLKADAEHFEEDPGRQSPPSVSSLDLSSNRKISIYYFNILFFQKTQFQKFFIKWKNLLFQAVIAHRLGDGLFSNQQLLLSESIKYNSQN